MNKLHKTPLAAVILAAFSLSFSAFANDIEPGKEYYTAIKAPVPIVLDGDLSEWRGAMLLADPRFSIPKGSGDDGELVFFEEYAGGKWTGPDDQTSAVQVVYDDDNVYFGFTVTDDYHENAANSAWNGDSVQLMIANDARDTQIALYNYALGGIENETGDVIVMHEAGPATGADATPTEAVIVRNAETKRTYYEIKLPKETLGLDELKGGVRFGLGMAINDGDEDTPGQKGWGGLGAHSIVFGKSPTETALVTLATSNDIEPGKEYYFANEAPGEITLDGELSDWRGIPVLADPRFTIPKGSARDGELKLFEEYAGGKWTGADDQTSAVQIAYDSDNVYFGFVVTDDYHENAANSAWNGDSIQLMIASANQDQQIALYNYALGGVEGETGDVIVMHEAGPATGADAEPTEAVIKRDEATKRTTYEIKLPKSTLGLESLELGTQFGLGMAINDGDEDTPGQKGWGGLGAHSIVFGKSPSETALVTLGIGGGNADLMFLSAVNVSIDSFTFRATDKGDSVVDPASAKLYINGNEVALTAGDKVLDATDFGFVGDKFEPNTEINYVIEISDSNGTLITDSGTIYSPSFGLLKAPMLATSVDTNKRGFVFRVWQNELTDHGNQTSAVKDILAAAPQDIDGSTLENDAYLDEAGPASGSGKLVGHLAEYEIPTVINLNGQVIDGMENGNFLPDDQMPGIPGNWGSYDGIAGEIITFIDFPEGMLTMGVNSDDGFELSIGHINDPRAMVAGSFNGGRGAADTTFEMDVRTAGIYPVRIVYFSQGGGANIELFTVSEAGEKVLVNANGGLMAYRSGEVPNYVEPEVPAALVAEGSASEPTVVDFGALEGDASYVFYFTAIKDGASTAIAGDNAFAIKLDQWNQQGLFGTTQFGVADNLFSAVDGQSVGSVFDVPVHVVIVSDSAAGESSLYINGVLSGTWAGSVPLSGQVKVMGARLEQATDHMGAGSNMHAWATYSGKLSASEVQSLYASRPEVSSDGAISSVALTDGNVVIEFTGTLKSATSVTGPYSAVAGASSPYSVSPSKAAEFYIAE
ncbi:MAG: sugar-binding protein [Verrucomicrobiota bacterium]|nr:sugar-binding protein [Verrucomicrobiota bacterium]